MLGDSCISTSIIRKLGKDINSGELVHIGNLKVRSKSMKVKLEDIIEGMEMQSEDNKSYLNLKTGEVINVSREALMLAEDEVEYDHLPEWQQDEVKTAIDIVESFDNYALLPTSFEINEYDMMESFCFSLSDLNKQEILLNSIRGKGAFRRFKDNVNRLGLVSQWYDYRDNSIKEIAREFCESKNIDSI